VTVYDAVKLLHDGIEHKQSSFMDIHAWYFTHEGVEYRLAEVKDKRLYLETYRLPRTIIHEVSLENQKGE
jgi:hypothetical protein